MLFYYHRFETCIANQRLFGWWPWSTKTAGSITLDNSLRENHNPSKTHRDFWGIYNLRNIFGQTHFPEAVHRCSLPVNNYWAGMEYHNSLKRVETADQMMSTNVFSNYSWSVLSFSTDILCFIMFHPNKQFSSKNKVPINPTVYSFPQVNCAFRIYSIP